MKRWNFWRIWSSKPPQPVSLKDVDTFLALVVRSGLMRAEELNELIAILDADRTLDNVCSHLIAQGVLTKWQCDKLRHGKFKGFFFEGYRLLSRLGMGETFSTYLGRQVSTGKLVEIDVTPPTIGPLKDGKFHYIVREITEEPPANIE